MPPSSRAAKSSSRSSVRFTLESKTWATLVTLAQFFKLSFHCHISAKNFNSQQNTTPIVMRIFGSNFKGSDTLFAPATMLNLLSQKVGISFELGSIRFQIALETRFRRDQSKKAFLQVSSNLSSQKATPISKLISSKTLLNFFSIF